MLGGSVGLGVAAVLPGADWALRASAAGADARQATPKGAIIRTVLKDVPPESLGAILFHEHVHQSITYGLKGGPGAAQPGQSFTEDFDLMAKELMAAAGEGLGSR